MSRTTAVWRRLAVATVASSLVLLSACGSSDDAATPAAAGSGTDTAAPAAGSGGSVVPDTAALLTAVKKDDALAAGVPVAITEKGTLAVGSNVQSPPNNFYAEDGTTVVGFEKDLITAVAAKLGLTVTYSDMAFDSLITSLQSSRIDVTIAGMNDNPKRQEAITFVDYFNSGITLMVQKGNPQAIKSSDDLCGKAIAVVTGTSQEDFAAEQSEKCTAAGNAAVEVTATDSDASNQTQLRTGRVAAIINDLPSAVYISKTAGDGEYFETVQQAPINGAPYGIGINKDNKELVTAVEKSLQSLIDDGTYGKILDAWQVTSGAVDKAVVNGG